MKCVFILHSQLDSDPDSADILDKSKCVLLKLIKFILQFFLVWYHLSIKYTCNLIQFIIYFSNIYSASMNTYKTNYPTYFSFILLAICKQI